MINKKKLSREACRDMIYWRWNRFKAKIAERLLGRNPFYQVVDSMWVECLISDIDLVKIDVAHSFSVEDELYNKVMKDYELIEEAEEKMFII